MKTVAYLGGERLGGTYRVFATLRDLLAPHGYAVELMNHKSAGYLGEDRDGPEAARALVSALSGFDAVIVNVFMGRGLMNVARYMPSAQPRLMIVHNVTRATYLAARALRDHVHHTVAISPRIRDDLVRTHGFHADGVTLVFHAVADELFEVPLARRDDTVVPLLSLGRLDDYAKNLSTIPRMLPASLRPDIRLTVAGDGPDRAAIEEAFRVSALDAAFVGVVPRERLAEVFGQHEAFLFPSRFEGMGIALAEAMAAGLVPVAARIRGITDAMIEDGVSGFVFDQGNFKSAQRAVATLLREPERRLAMRQAARARARELFGPARMASAYAGLLGRILDDPAALPCLPLDDWRIPFAMTSGLRGLVPAGLRRRLADWVIYRG